MNSPISHYLRARFPDADHTTLTALAQHADVTLAAAAFDASIEGTLAALQHPSMPVNADDEAIVDSAAGVMEEATDKGSAAEAAVAQAKAAECDTPPIASTPVEMDAVETGTTPDVETDIDPVPTPTVAPALAAAGLPATEQPAIAVPEAVVWVPPALEPESPPVSPPVAGHVTAPVVAAGPADAQAGSAAPALQFALRNLRQAEAGESELTTVPEGQTFELVDVRFPEGLGLAFDADRKCIFGTPQLNGEFTLAVQYRALDAPGVGVRSATVSLLVNADPKLLWKNLPSDRNDTFWKEDRAQCVVEGGTRRVVAARQRGRSHAHVGSFCEDDYQVAYLDNGWYITVVADGAGSAKYSRRGSKIACEAASERLKELLSGDAGEDLLAAVRQLLAGDYDSRERNEGKLRNALYVTVGYAAHAAMKAHYDEVAKGGEVKSLRELATTLLVGVSHEVYGKQLCAAYWVGDGAVGVYQAGHSVHVLGDVDSGEYSGQTRFLDANEVSQEALIKRLRFVVVDDFTAFILMTDGVSDAKFETEARLLKRESWDALWTDLESVAQLSVRDAGVSDRLQRWLEFWSPGNHDDRAIAILY